MLSVVKGGGQRQGEERGRERERGPRASKGGKRRYGRASRSQSHVQHVVVSLWSHPPYKGKVSY